MSKSILNHPDEHEVRIQLYLEPKFRHHEPYWGHLRLRDATIPTAFLRPSNGRHRCKATFLFVWCYPAKVQCSPDPFLFGLHKPYSDKWRYLRTDRIPLGNESYPFFHRWHYADNSDHNYHRGIPIRQLSNPLNFLSPKIALFFVSSKTNPSTRYTVPSEVSVQKPQGILQVIHFRTWRSFARGNRGNDEMNFALEMKIDPLFIRGGNDVISRTDSIRFFCQYTLLLSQSFNHFNIFFTDINIFYNFLAGFTLPQHIKNILLGFQIVVYSI